MHGFRSQLLPSLGICYKRERAGRLCAFVRILRARVSYRTTSYVAQSRILIHKVDEQLRGGLESAHYYHFKR